MTARELLVVAVAIGISGCRPAELPEPAGTASDAANPLLEQIAAVERGETASIELGEREISDQDVLALADFSNLESFVAHRAHLTDEGLKCFSGLVALKTLNLGETRVTDAGLESLVGLSHLELLRIESPSITDAGLATLAELQSLRQLILVGARIEGPGLQNLVGLENLESLYLIDTPVAEEWLARLQSQRPDLHLHW
jgi:hypothetical protein